MAEKNLYTVIVADDEDELREAVCTMIPWEALGFHLVGSASNGLDASNLSSSWNPTCCSPTSACPSSPALSWPARSARSAPPCTLPF